MCGVLNFLSHDAWNHDTLSSRVKSIEESYGASPVPLMCGVRNALFYEISLNESFCDERFFNLSIS